MDRLTRSQTRQVAQLRSRWAAIAACAEPADRPAAEAGVERAYRAARLAPPRIVWCDGPLQFAEAWREGSSQEIGGNVRREICERPLAGVVVFAESRLSLSVRHAVINATRLPASTSVAVNEAVNAAINEARPSFWARLASGWRMRVPRFGESGWGQPDYAWLAACEYFADLCGFEDNGAFDAALSIAKTSGWVVPYERVCWLGERPTALHVDSRGRLHCATGPALSYRDGLTVHMWKGVPIPNWMIEQPHLITPQFIERHPDFLLRRCMIEILTPARYVANGGALPVAKDDTGVLWRKQWWNNDAWAAVEVVNGTPDPDGSFRHYFLQVPPHVRSPREAVAWTYGLTEAEYARLRVRT
jgi:hypothetical protein